MLSTYPDLFFSRQDGVQIENRHLFRSYDYCGGLSDIQ